MWTKVVSSNIAEVAHDIERLVLLVKFTSGKVYQYENVPGALFMQLLAAPSIGKAFNSLVKSQPEAYPASLYPTEDVMNAEINSPWPPVGLAGN